MMKAGQEAIAKMRQLNSRIADPGISADIGRLEPMMARVGHSDNGDQQKPDPDPTVGQDVGQSQI